MDSVRRTLMNSPKSDTNKYSNVVPWLAVVYLVSSASLSTFERAPLGERVLSGGWKKAIWSGGYCLLSWFWGMNSQLNASV